MKNWLCDPQELKEWFKRWELRGYLKGRSEAVSEALEIISKAENNFAYSDLETLKRVLKDHQKFLFNKISRLVKK